MKKFLFHSFILFCLTLSSVSARLILISDFDDTIKISGSKKLTTGLKYIFKDNAYAGAPEFYQTLSSSYEKVYFVSNSPLILREKYVSFLLKNNIPRFEFHNKNYLKHSLNFKKDKIVEIIKNNLDAEFILLGDDLEKDPEIYHEIKLEYPHLIKSIFIHKLTNNKLPEGILEYVTYFDLAVKMFEIGLVNDEEITDIAQNILTSPFEYILPPFSECPKIDQYQLKTFTNNQELYWQLVKAFINKNCSY